MKPKALYSRNTKTRSTSLYVTDYAVKGDFCAREAVESFEPKIRVTIAGKVDDGKERAFTFYGHEVPRLIDRLTAAYKKALEEEKRIFGEETVN